MVGYAEINSIGIEPQWATGWSKQMIQTGGNFGDGRDLDGGQSSLAGMPCLRQNGYFERAFPTPVIKSAATPEKVMSAAAIQAGKSRPKGV